jgi:hypothetical protein
MIFEKIFIQLCFTTELKLGWKELLPWAPKVLLNITNGHRLKNLERLLKDFTFKTR